MAKYLEDAKTGFDKAIDNLKRDFTRVRTGRANLSILDGLNVDYYGSPSPVSQVASCNVADPRLITIKPWDKGMLTAIEKAILTSSIGITPSNDGTLIRLPIPPLTGERRKDLVKGLGKTAEAAKVAVRGVRRDIKEIIESDELPEDEMHVLTKKLQDLTDEYISKVDKLADEKEKEIMDS
jgi:ribosome recycling factor